MNITPPLSTNRFAPLCTYLDISTISDTPIATETVVNPKPVPKPHHRPKWERRLPATFVICSMADRSLQLKVGLQTTDTGESFAPTALLDSGATGCFLDRDYVRRNNINTRPLSQPIPVQ